jgi:hypothetical protein
MGLLTRAGNVLGDIGRNVPAGSNRDRLVGALASGVEGAQNMLAGKYAQDVKAALSPANTAQYAPLAYGLIGAGGSVVGNALSGEEKDPGRILAEAAGAGALGALAGRSIGQRGAELQKARAVQEPVMNAMDRAAVQYEMRARKAAEAGATSTAQAARNKVLNLVNNLAAGEQAMKQFSRDTRVGQGLMMAGLPGLAGLGGMAGGGVSNIAQSLGVPGFQQQQITDPEAYGSSNSPGARYKTPTMQYL